MKKLTLLFALLILSICFAYDGEDYLPLETGNIWEYADSSEESTGTSTHTIINSSTLDGYLTYYLERASSDGSTDTAMFQIRDDGYYTIDRPMSSMGFDMEVLIKLFPLSFELGDSWVAAEIETTISAMGMEFPVTITLQTEAVELADITVPAGIFTNSILMEMTAIYDAGITSGDFVSTRQWLAEDIGVVQDYFNRYNPLDGTGIEEWSFLTDYSMEKIIEQHSTPENISITSYPNPFNGNCKIELENPDIITIIDLNGKIVYNSNTPVSIINWHPENNPTGVYKVVTKSGIQSENLLYIK